MKRLLLAMLIFQQILLIESLMAQRKEVVTSVRSSETIESFAVDSIKSMRLIDLTDTVGIYLPYTWKEAWFLGGALGAEVYWGYEDSLGPFGKRVQPCAQFYFGKWVFPYLGFRVMWMMGDLAGYIRKNTRYVVGDPDPNGLYYYKMRYQSLGSDILFDATEYFGRKRYSRKHFYHCIPYIGAGVLRYDVIPSSGSYDNEFYLNLGVLNTFRIYKGLDLIVDIKSVAQRTYINYNIYGGVNKIWNFFTPLSVGLSYTFGARNKARAITFQNVMPVMKEIHYRKDTVTLNSIKYLPVAKVIRDTIVKVDTLRISEIAPQVVPSTYIVFFVIDRTNVSLREKTKLQFASEMINKNPNKQFVLIGSADPQTGTPSRNQWLCQQRVKNVYDMLVNQYQVNPDQLIQRVSVHSSFPMVQNELNRSVLIIEKSSLDESQPLNHKYSEPFNKNRIVR